MNPPLQPRTAHKLLRVCLNCASWAKTAPHQPHLAASQTLGQERYPATAAIGLLRSRPTHTLLKHCAS
jgi:hypothetical protein